MKAYKGTFRKKDGTIRNMVFAKLTDIAEVNKNFIGLKIVGDGSPKNYGPDQELVWDIEADNFRVFNWGKASKVEPIEIDSSIFA